MTMTHCPRLSLTAPAVAVIALLLAGCTGTPSLPMVDDSQRRPVNAAGAIELQACRAELQAARLLISEAPAASCPAPAARTQVAAVSEARTAVLLFERGQSRIDLDAETLQSLRELARTASRVEIHARGDQLQDTPAETALARRRAEATAVWVANRLGVAAERLRVSWTGMAEAGLAADQRRRVEIEFVEHSTPVLLTRAAAPASSQTAPMPVQASAAAPGTLPPASRTALPGPSQLRASNPPPTSSAVSAPAASPSPPVAPTSRPAARPDAPVALQVRQPG